MRFSLHKFFMDLCHEQCSIRQASSIRFVSFFQMENSMESWPNVVRLAKIMPWKRSIAGISSRQPSMPRWLAPVCIRRKFVVPPAYVSLVVRRAWCRPKMDTIVTVRTMARAVNSIKIAVKRVRWDWFSVRCKKRVQWNCNMDRHLMIRSIIVATKWKPPTTQSYSPMTVSDNSWNQNRIPKSLKCLLIVFIAVDLCSKTVGLCEQICEDTGDSQVQCKCETGYRLKDDKRSCEKLSNESDDKSTDPSANGTE